MHRQAADQISGGTKRGWRIGPGQLVRAVAPEEFHLIVGDVGVKGSRKPIAQRGLESAFETALAARGLLAEWSCEQVG